tara:strand:- start:529 stop:1191 length:663 start_codon:yes stop_codon:yes gene_type:complete
MSHIINLLIILFIVLLIIFIIWFFWYRRNNKNETFSELKNIEEVEFGYKGIVLFDVDGTLTTGNENYKVVDHFIKNNYVVGIVTAGSIYNKENLSTWEWMPNNLYTFISDNKFVSFNNVASSILCGEYNPTQYEMNKLKIPIIEGKQSMGYQIGWDKGFSLMECALKFGIINPKKMILIDNDPYFLDGAKLFNQEFILIPGGKPAAMDNLKLENLLSYLY